MPNMAVYDMQGEKTGDVDVPDEIMGLPYNPDLVHQAIRAVDAQRRRRAGKTKGRAEVRGTSAKWYRQKGLGRARHGARSAPLFVGGGVAHGPTGVQRTFKMPKRMRGKALFVALSQRAREGSMTIINAFGLDGISTARFVEVLEDLDLGGRVLMLLSPEEANDEVLYKSARNVPDLIAREVPHFNTREVVWAEDILITRGALDRIMQGALGDAD